MNSRPPQQISSKATLTHIQWSGPPRGRARLRAFALVACWLAAVAAAAWTCWRIGTELPLRGLWIAAGFAVLEILLGAVTPGRFTRPLVVAAVAGAVLLWGLPAATPH